MTNSSLGTIRRLPSRRYQARGTIRGRQVALGTSTPAARQPKPSPGRTPIRGGERTSTGQRPPPFVPLCRHVVVDALGPPPQPPAARPPLSRPPHPACSRPSPLV